MSGVVIGREDTRISITRGKLGGLDIKVYADGNCAGLILLAFAEHGDCEITMPPTAVVPTLRAGNTFIPLADAEVVEAVRAELGMLQ